MNKLFFFFTAISLATSSAALAKTSVRECLNLSREEVKLLDKAIATSAPKLLELNKLVSPFLKSSMASANQVLVDRHSPGTQVSEADATLADDLRSFVYSQILRLATKAGLGELDGTYLRVDAVDFEDKDLPSLQRVSTGLNYWTDENGNLQLITIIQRRNDMRTPEQKKIKNYVNYAGYSDSLVLSQTKEGEVLIQYELSPLAHASNPSVDVLFGPPQRAIKLQAVGGLKNLACD